MADDRWVEERWGDMAAARGEVEKFLRPAARYRWPWSVRRAPLDDLNGIIFTTDDCQTKGID